MCCRVGSFDEIKKEGEFPNDSLYAYECWVLQLPWALEPEL